MDSPATPILQPVPKPLPLNKILFLISFISLILAGYFIYQNRLLQQRLAAIETSQLPTPVEPTPTTPDETVIIPADWKGYSFPNASLRFSTPPTFTVTLDEPNPDSFTLYIQNYKNSISEVTSPYQLYGLFQPGNYGDTEFYIEELKADLEPTSIKDITIGGFAGVEGQIRGNRNRFAAYILTNIGKWGFFTSPSTSINKGISDQILSTFKFFGTPTDETANWKTRTNSIYKYQFKYPPTWNDISDPRSEGKEVTIETPDQERVHATIFEGTPNPQNANQLALPNNKYISFSYVTCDGPGCSSGTRESETFRLILSTFKPLN